MIIAYEDPSAVDSRLSRVPASGPGPATMEIVNDDKSRYIPPQYSAPPPPAPMGRMPPADAPHGLPAPGAPVVYDQAWRGPYPPAYDPHHAEPRRPSNGPGPGPQPPMPSQAYPPMQNRELPPFPPEGPYGRPASLPAPTHAPSEPPPPPNTNYHQPMNGSMHESSPLSAPEFRGRMSYPPPDQVPHTNGDGPLPPQSLPPNQYPPQGPPISQTPGPYDAGYYQTGSMNMRHRKATRAQQACDQCRARKAKCDEGRPACSHCKENSLVCIYKEVPPHKQEKSTQLVIDRLQAMEDFITGKFDSLSNLQRTFETKLDHLVFENNKKPSTKTTQPTVKVDRMKESVEPEVKTQEPDDDEHSRANMYARGLLQTTGEDGELSIPVEHTTAAHKLLGWPSITQLLQPYHYDEDYVMRLEQRRGVIRVEGRGEEREDAKDFDDDIVSQTTSINTSMDGGSSFDTSPPTVAWNANTRFNETPPEFKGLDEDGVMLLDAETVRQYRDSYMEHIHKLHPFIGVHDLTAGVERFIGLHCRQPAHNAQNLMEAPRGAKRKRSGETMHQPAYDASPPTGPQRVEKTLFNAIIMLVLALGRICEVRDQPIRGPCTDHVIDYRNEPTPVTPPRGPVSPAGLESMGPPKGSFYSPYQKHSVSTPFVTDDSLLTLPDPPHLQNTDTVPGLVYYQYATRILGNLQGATSLRYAQATLLASLYAGQLAHPFQSYSWVAQAARACQVLTVDKSYRLLSPGTYKDLVEFAFWTCLQLESDMLAELDLPASGISRSEARITHPGGTHSIGANGDELAPETKIMFHYSAQIHLRKILDSVHRNLYKVDRQGGNVWKSSVQEMLNVNLDLWRSSLPPGMRWKNSDPPASDINVARLRAKYFGARYIIHRPLLYHALEYSGPDKGAPAPMSDMRPGYTPGSSQTQMSPHGQQGADMTRISSDLGLGAMKVNNYRELPQKLRRACAICVDSAIRSTTAFDGVKGRPVVTNIFGTAHAQFGNMLVLSTVYMSHLTELVNREQLERLLRRTIAFLLRHRNISPSLRADAKILTDIYEKIFDEPPIITASDVDNGLSA
ncbi:hypothetical protein BJY04DRAFT_232749 [Aspergillus karnatakaensis]|uniref:putative C6 finger domain protein n=1 Tax=Aspergillus karnatakaensis TaxID=1810916 RepID=UPI003CCCAF6C